MRLVAAFESMAQRLLDQADRNSRARDAEIQARKTAGADAGSGTFPGTTTKYGLLDTTPIEDFYLH